MSTVVQLNPERQWRRAASLFALLLVWMLFWYLDTASAIVRIWLRSDAFTHGFLVVPIVVWLVWRRRGALSHIQPRPNLWAILLLAGAGLAWLLGDLVAVNALTQLAFVSMLVLLVPTLLGWAITRVLGFALAFLFFAVPFGEFAMPQLMTWTADFTVIALRLTGIPVYREGLQFVIPSGNWSVVEACSGVRYLIASLTVGTLFAYLNYQSTQRRILFIIVSIIVPVVANWLRAYMIVMLGHLSGNKLAAGVDHLIYGWVFFGVVIMLMFMIGARWAELEPSVSAADIDSVTLQKPMQQMPVVRSRFELVAFLAALLVVTPYLGRWALNHTGNLAPPTLAAPAVLAPNWVAAADQVLVFKPAFSNPSAEFNTRYLAGAQDVGLYVGYYRQQNYDRKLVSSQNVLVASRDPYWAQVSSSTQSIQFNKAQTPVRVAELRNSGAPGQLADARLIVWQLYWVNGKLTVSDMQAKVYGALYRLLGRGDDSAVIIVYTVKGQGDEGQARLQAFVQANGGSIIALLEKTR
jgi:exosortase A